MKKLILGTRGSKLAVAQSTWVAETITAMTGSVVELKIITTKGDLILDKPLAEIGGKGLFTHELEQALLNRTIDFAVHSCKDLPTENPPGLHIACYPKREDPRDALIGGPLDDNVIVGTGSARRQAQLGLLSAVTFKGIRGNVDTRIRKMENGDYERVVLAMAGLNRVGIKRNDVVPLSIEECVPAPAQGALALQVNSERVEVIEILEKIQCMETKIAVEAERNFLHEIGGGCHAALGAYVKSISNEPNDKYEMFVFFKEGSQVFKFHEETFEPMKLSSLLAQTIQNGK